MIRVGINIPISTKTIADRSNSERGLSAERIPIGIASSIHRIAPPITKEAVTGAASPTIELTGRRFTNERPSDWSTTSRFRNSRYCIGTEWSSPMKWRTRSMSAGLAAFPAARTAGS
jgi:hypothetical protein